MSVETYSTKLLTSRSHNAQYAEVRIKLAIKRLICKIRFVQKHSTVDYQGFDPTKFINGKWELDPTRFNRGCDPLSLLKLHSSISARDKAFGACIGLRVKDSLRSGFDPYGKYAGASKMSELFFDIGRYLSKKTLTIGVPSKNYLPLRWRELIDEEWKRTEPKDIKSNSGATDTGLFRVPGVLDEFFQ
jgi:hypothetical protein